MTNIAKTEGIGPPYAENLGAAGIKPTETLLEAGRKAKAREETRQK